MPASPSQAADTSVTVDFAIAGGAPTNHAFSGGYATSTVSTVAVSENGGRCLDDTNLSTANGTQQELTPTPPRCLGDTWRFDSLTRGGGDFRLTLRLAQSVS